MWSFEARQPEETAYFSGMFVIGNFHGERFDTADSADDPCSR